MGISTGDFQTRSSLFTQPALVVVGVGRARLQLRGVFFVAVDGALGSSSLLGLRALVEVVRGQARFLEAGLFDQLVLMRAPVGLQLAELREAFVADVAGVGLFARVQAHVLVKLAGLRKRLATFAAFVRLLT